MTALGLGALVAPTAASAETVVFNYSGTDGNDGNPQFWSVPAGVTSATFDLYGARGGTPAGAPLGGFGAHVHAVLPVTPGAELLVMVGGTPFGSTLPTSLGGFNGGGRARGFGGGGGGASDVRIGSALASRILVAAGGGGSGNIGGGRGGDSGADGIAGSTQGVAQGGQPGLAGTSTAAGDGGAGGSGFATGEAGFPGAEGLGGAGGGGIAGGGGGGGGLFGGGGGGAGGAPPPPSLSPGGGGGGGGGSSYAHPAATDVQIHDGASPGHGVVAITFQPASAPPGGAPRPNTRITRKPGDNRKRNRRWVFKFEDDLPGVTFLCRLDKRQFEPCTSPKVYKGLEPGRHTFRVKSVDQHGVESTPRTARFRVRGKRR